IMDEDEHAMEVIVPDDQLSLAIGKKGQNIRLASRLTTWKLDVRSESEAEDEARRARASLTAVPGISDLTAELLIQDGVKSAEQRARPAAYLRGMRHAGAAVRPDALHGHGGGPARRRRPSRGRARGVPAWSADLLGRVRAPPWGCSLASAHASDARAGAPAGAAGHGLGDFEVRADVKANPRAGQRLGRRPEGHPGARREARPPGQALPELAHRRGSRAAEGRSRPFAAAG